jgi:hypothetical protein
MPDSQSHEMQANSEARYNHIPDPVSGVGRDGLAPTFQSRGVEW